MVDRYIKFTLAISVINRYIQKIEKNAMRKYGLKGSHAQCIVALLNSPDGITATDLCKFTDKDKAAVSRTVAELEECGHVKRLGEGENMYRARLVLTESGEKIGAEITGLVNKAVAQADTGLLEKDREAFYNTLALFTSNLYNITKTGIK